MSEVIVVGAGLAGLTAAILCARAGHEVRVLERYKRVGGAPGHHPSVDSTPMLPERMGKLLGIELKPPQITPTPTVRFFVYGKSYTMDGHRQYVHAVERGSRPTSLENYLYRIAQEAGVSFEFGWTLKSQKDAAELPPGSIIATGLHHESYLALGIPWQDVYGFVANGRFEGPPMAVAWFDTFAGDYSYFANANGIGFALAFDRQPLPRHAQESFVKRLHQDLGVELEGWRTFEGAVGVKRLDNPRLFSGPLILAGSLAGMQDPFFFFGVHASLISGSIAALAVDDKAAAWERFRKISVLYKYSFVGRRLFEPLPHHVRKPLLHAFMAMQLRWPDRFGGLTLHTIPGFMDLKGVG
jgi:flavin-dependent dehydrogenase